MSHRLASGHLTSRFIENRGQADPSFFFYVQGALNSAAFSDHGMQVLVSSSGAKGAARWTMDLEFVDAVPVQPIGVVLSPTVVNHLGGRPEDWRSGVPTYASIRYEQLWPGIDVEFLLDGSRLKYQFILAPGADPDLIRLRWKGASGIEIAPDGSLEVETPVRRLVDPPPLSFQQAGARTTTVPSAYRIAGSGASGTEYGFAVGSYDPGRPLVIDPVVFESVALLGSAGNENPSGVALDPAGNIYVTGWTYSPRSTFLDGRIGEWPTFDSTPNAVQDPDFNQPDGFILKLNAGGDEILHASFIGPAMPTGIAVDESGAAYVTGVAANPAVFPAGTGFGGLPRFDSGSTKPLERGVFVAKVAASGTAVDYAGFLAGTLSTDIAVDASGAAYVVGFTDQDQTVFPDGDGFGDVPGADTTFNNPGERGRNDGFAVKVNPAGTSLQYATYVGGNIGDQVYGVAVDGAGSAHLVGVTESDPSSFPDGDGVGDLPGAFVAPSERGDMGFFVALDPSGSRFTSASYLPGTDAGDIALDRASNVYLVGSGYSTGRLLEAVPGSRPGPDITPNGGREGFVAKMSPGGLDVIWAGFIGGAGSDWASAVAVGPDGGVYVGGSTQSDQASFPDGNGFGLVPGPDRTFDARVETNGFVAKVNSSGLGLDYATYAGAGPALGHTLAVTGEGEAVFAGMTLSSPSAFSDADGQWSSLEVRAESAKVNADFFVVRIGRAPAAVLPVRPSTLVRLSAGQASNSKLSPVRFTVAFSAPVTGFDSSDVRLEGSAEPAELAVSVSGGPATYQVNVTGMRTRGSVTLSVPAGAASDAQGSDNLPGGPATVNWAGPPNIYLGWGYNGLGTLGDRSYTTRPQVATATSPDPGVFTQVSAGGFHSLGLREDGSVWAWGWNGFGQLGNHSTTTEAVPVRIMAPANMKFRSVSAGLYHSLAVTETGEVWAWGWNGLRQAGHHSAAYLDAPHRVTAITGAVEEVSAGAFHSLARRSDGSVVAWGWNGFGQLGIGTTGDGAPPVEVLGPGQSRAIAAGGFHSLSLAPDGTVKAWGFNALGAVGDGTAVDRLTPVPLPGLSSVSGISAGLYHTLAVRQDGNVFGWGWSAFGAVGDGSREARLSPMPVAGLSGVTGVSAGGLHSLAVRADGTVAAWGYNGYGALGDGSTSDRQTPATVPGADGIGSLSGGLFHSLALKRYP